MNKPQGVQDIHKHQQDSRPANSSLFLLRQHTIVITPITPPNTVMAITAATDRTYTSSPVKNNRTLLCMVAILLYDCRLTTTMYILQTTYARCCERNYNIIQLPLLFSAETADCSVLSASVGVIRPYLEKEMRELVLMGVSLSS